MSNAMMIARTTGIGLVPPPMVQYTNRRTPADLEPMREIDALLKRTQALLLHLGPIEGAQLQTFAEACRTQIAYAIQQSRYDLAVRPFEALRRVVEAKARMIGA